MSWFSSHLQDSLRLIREVTSSSARIIDVGAARPRWWRTWLVADVTKLELAENSFELWHDRAAFHFLAEASDAGVAVVTVIERVFVRGRQVGFEWRTLGNERNRLRDQVFLGC